MSSIRIGINGAGRIGRYLVRLLAGSNTFQLKSLNSSGSRETVAHLIKYDSVHGTLKEDVRVLGKGIQVGSQDFTYTQSRNIEDISWNDVDVVIDSTGIFKTKAELQKHVKDQVKHVVLAAPGKDLDWTVVFGVNHTDYNPAQHSIISNASCTTNCLAPLAQVMNQEFKIEEGYMTTVHAYTGDQKILDSAHKDLRRARAAALSIIPTSTGATKAVEEVLPELKGKLEGLSIRVPVANVSLVELTLRCQKSMSLKDIRKAFEKYTLTFPSVLRIEDKPLVSQDFMGSSYSTILDFELTKVKGKTVQLFAWYDNEAGYSNRLLDIIKHISTS